MQKGSFKNMKIQNQKNILALIKKEADISRADIAAELDISRATVTNIVRELIKNKLVKESKIGKSSGGRRPMLLQLRSDAAFIIGLEWGIEAVKAVLLNFKAEIIAAEEKLSQKKTLAEYQSLSCSLIEKFKDILAAEANIIGIGLGIHGLVDPKEGKSIFTPHFNWQELNIKAVLEKKYDYPTLIDNDVRMMAAGEIARGRDNFIFINTGSGIGSALVFNSKLYYGNNYAAGEFGHMKLTTAQNSFHSDEGQKSKTNKNNKEAEKTTKKTLEALASKESIINRYQKLKNLKTEPDFKEIINNYQKEEKEAVLVIETALNFFAGAIANLVNILNPEAVVIGGLFAEYKEIFIDGTAKIVKKEVLDQALKDLKIETAYYQEKAGAVGAGLKVLNNFFEFELKGGRK